MAVITVRVSHLFILSLLVLNVIANVVDLTPMCGTIDGSPPKDSTKIYFKDDSQRIRTIEVNGRTYACYPDGTMIDTTSSSSAEVNGDKISGTQLNDRMNNEERNLTQRHVPSTKYIANVTRCAVNNLSFCTTLDGYPIDVIQILLQEHLHKFADVFGSDMISTNITNRSDASDEITLCDFIEEVIYPTSGKNINGEELFIINTKEHKQGIRVSRCKDRGASCSMSDHFPNGYRTECKQHFVYRELLSLSSDGHSVTKDKFEFPACCSCAVYRT